MRKYATESMYGMYLYSLLCFALAGKLGALEDWRTARLDLMRKFELQEEEIARQNELHKTRLYEAEKSVIIAKAT